jgi:hypothetical protein
MCKQQRLREQSRAAAAAAEAAPAAPAASVAPAGTKPAGGAAVREKASGMWEERTFGALPSTFRAAEPGEVWVSPDPKNGEIVGHLPGTPCLNDGVNPDETGLWEKWGRVQSPTARQDLTNKTAVTTTDGTGLVATRWCRHCKDLGV